MRAYVCMYNTYTKNFAIILFYTIKNRIFYNVAVQLWTFRVISIKIN